MSRLWEVDPETRSKLLIIQKSKGNDRCCDCGAPSPQWASPKFGTFICLNCAGTHRGLGVHISFVRSITMDAFKLAEIQRMEHGGNDTWQKFFDSHTITISEGRTFEDSTVKERYSGEVGEEYKERLTAKAEGKKYVPGERSKKPEISRSSASTPRGLGNDRSLERDPLSRSRSAAGVGGGGSAGSGENMFGGRKEQNEAYFAQLGGQNAARPDGLPPSQGGKFAGFGGGMPPSPTGSSRQGGNVPGLNDFQNDPVAALTKGFGWFTTTVGKGAKTMNDTYIQPAAKSIAESDLAAQARIAAAGVSQNIQTNTRGATESFNRFVEGTDHSEGHPRSSNASRRFEPERKDFWDSFAALGEERETGTARSGAIGTGTMKRSNTMGSAVNATQSSAAKAKPKVKDDGWDDSW